MRMLTKIFKNEGSELPVSRLMWVSGKETMMACYYIGIYVNKEIIGHGTSRVNKDDLLQQHGVLELVIFIFLFQLPENQRR